MKIRSITDIGIKRKDNQDNYWASRLSIDGEEVGVVCLCDGMGGLDNGALASRMVVESVRNYLLSDSRFEGLEGVIREVNKSIFGLGSKMGTTCTLIVCSGGKYKILHVGDSRCYLLRWGILKPLTTDHSALTKYNITKEKNPKLYNKYKNALTRCIGVTDSVELDYIEGTYLRGDSFFLCSDGFWHYLEDNDCTSEDLADLQDMVRKCIDNGETDNITVGVLEI